MNTELKKAIVNYMLDNIKEFQLGNATRTKFRQYIYTTDGNYCIGGESVSEFISNVNKHIINHK